MAEHQKSIVFVGVGIKFFSHITQEALATITECDKLYYLVNEPAMIEWLARSNKIAESLEDIYYAFDTRLEAYQNISQKIIREADNYSNICVAMYGHPLVLNLPTKLTVEAASSNNLNINVQVLPGISAESVMYCDLGIDPGIGGIQSYEASEFIYKKKIIDTTSHLVLWQVGVIGSEGRTEYHDNSEGIQLLQDYLLCLYPSNHKLVLYEAAQYPHIEPVITTTDIKGLSKAAISKLMTCYIEPVNTMFGLKKEFT